MNMQAQLQAALDAAQQHVAPAAPAVDDSPTVAPVTLPAADDVETNWQQVADVLPDAARSIVKIKDLHEKALLVKVKRRMYNPYTKDHAESERYQAGNVNKHLFKGRDNRVAIAIAAYNAVYIFVKDNTVPWSTGVEMLNADNYINFTTGLRNLMDAADAAVEDCVYNWQYEVAKDYNRLLPTGRANYDDYPTEAQVRERFSIDVQYSPIPKVDGFDPRLGISEADKASLQRQLDDAETNATKHVIAQMLEPMTAAASKLAVPIGNDGHIFRDSLIDNMVDVADRMGRVNISDDPVIAERIKDLRSLVGTYANNKDVLRNSQTVREKAATQIDDLMSQMSGLV